MNFENMPTESEFLFKQEDLEGNKVAKKLLALPDFQSLNDYFQADDVEGEFSCSLNVLANRTFITKNEAPIVAKSFIEAQEKIGAWINLELEKISAENGGAEFELKKFLIDFSFKQNGEEVKTGWRRVLDSDWSKS